MVDPAGRNGAAPCGRARLRTAGAPSQAVRLPRVGLVPAGSSAPARGCRTVDGAIAAVARAPGVGRDHRRSRSDPRGRARGGGRRGARARGVPRGRPTHGRPLRRTRRHRSRRVDSSAGRRRSAARSGRRSQRSRGVPDVARRHSHRRGARCGGRLGARGPVPRRIAASAQPARPGALPALGTRAGSGAARHGRDRRRRTSAATPEPEGPGSVRRSRCGRRRPGVVDRVLGRRRPRPGGLRRRRPRGRTTGRWSSCCDARDAVPITRDVLGLLSTPVDIRVVG